MVPKSPHIPVELARDPLPRKFLLGNDMGEHRVGAIVNYNQRGGLLLVAPLALLKTIVEVELADSVHEGLLLLAPPVCPRLRPSLDTALAPGAIRIVRDLVFSAFPISWRRNRGRSPRPSTLIGLHSTISRHPTTSSFFLTFIGLNGTLISCEITRSSLRLLFPKQSPNVRARKNLIPLHAPLKLVVILRFVPLHFLLGLKLLIHLHTQHLCRIHLLHSCNRSYVNVPVERVFKRGDHRSYCGRGKPEPTSLTGGIHIVNVYTPSLL